MPIKHIFLALSVPILWGIGFTITKAGMDQFPPMLINGLRWTLTGLILVWWFPIPRKYLKKIFIVSVIGCTIQYSLTYSGSLVGLFLIFYYLIIYELDLNYFNSFN